MTQHIVFDDALNLIRVAVAGEMTLAEKPDLLDAILDAINAIKSEHDCNKVLMDVSAVEKTPGVTSFYEFAGRLPFDIYIALMVDSNDNADFQFLENTSLNRGRNVRCFRDEQQALSWLNASNKFS